MEGTSAQTPLLTAMQLAPSQESLSTTPFQSSPSPDTTPTGSTPPPENGIQAPSPINRPSSVQSAKDVTPTASSNTSTPSRTPVKQSPSPTTQSSASNSGTQSPAKKPRTRPRSKTQVETGEGNSGNTSTSGEGTGSPIHAVKEKPTIDVKRLEVTGFPSFAKPQDLYKLFSNYGHTRVEHISKKYAIIKFATKEQAAVALQDSTKLCLYGEFLTMKPCTAIEEQKLPDQKNKNTVMIVDPATIPLEGSFGEQLGALLAAVRLTQEQVATVATLYEDLERVLQSTWPGCQAIPFGSITTGLGVKSSDADCFMYIPPQFRHAQFSFVNRARRILQQQPHLFTEVFAIPRANTPIVKLFHVPTHMHCDLTFKTPLGALNSKLVAFLLHADPRFVPVAVAVKYWAGAHALTGTGRLTNYALTLLMVFYLQQRGLLPPVARLQGPAAGAAPVHVDGWDAGFAHERPPPRAPAEPAPLHDLLGGFFAYYAAFDFDALVACPLLGRPVEKALFAEPARLPDELERYRRNVADHRAAPFRHKSPMCVQDPFEHSHNVASAVSTRLAAEIVAYVKFAAETYEREKAAECRGFLRTVLLECPPALRVNALPEYRVHLYPRVLEAIVREDWKAALREAAFTVFERILKLKLTPVGEKETVKGREREKYATTMTKVLWKRRKFTRVCDAVDPGFVEKHSRITEEIPDEKHDAVRVEFHVILLFCTKIKSGGVSIKMVDGDMNAFHLFGKYCLSSLQSLLLGVLQASKAAQIKANPNGTAPQDAVDSDMKNSDVESENLVESGAEGEGSAEDLEVTVAK